MENKSPREKEVFVDLESGMKAVVGEQDGFKDNSSSNKAWNGFMSNDGPMRGEEGAISRHNSSASVEKPFENREAIMDRRSSGGEERVGQLEKTAGIEKPRKKGCKKPPKPPRPPKSLLLDASDQKIVQEMSKLAMLKRARMERMKALKKMKNAKAMTSNNNSNLCALVITILFCLVILWQGVFTKGASNVSFHSSPESSAGHRGRFISVQFYKNASTSGSHVSNSVSPNVVEQVSGMDGHAEASRTTG